ncbi:hypothetical protein QZH41_012418, partial [Actinostola sp. cb2023]
IPANTLIEKGTMEVNEIKVNLEFFLGGDYKFLLIAMGMKAANSGHSCIWCKVSSSQRCQLSLTREYFQERQRVLHDNWPKDDGCNTTPLFQIPVDPVAFDELHMLLRVTDRLETGLILDMEHWDQKDAFVEGKRQQDSHHVNALLKAIKGCGVNFSVWKGKDGKLEWTSLMGNDKKRLLKLLPEKFPEILRPATCEQITKLWKDFRELYHVITSDSPTQTEIKNFHSEAILWAKHLVSLNKLPGYNQINPITPYIHILVYHAFDVLERYDSVKTFSGQGVEKKNDDFRRYFMRKINRWDACASMLKVEKRQEVLRYKERLSRVYRKLDLEFWFLGGKEQAASQLSTSPVQH